MTLARRVGTLLAGLAVGLVLLATLGIVSVLGLNRDLDAAAVEYDRLRQTYELARRVVRAREVVAGVADAAARRSDASPAALPSASGTSVRGWRAVVAAEVWMDQAVAAGRLDAGLAERVGPKLAEAAEALREAGAAGSPGLIAAVGALDRALNVLGAESQASRVRIDAIQRQADGHRGRAIAAMVGGAAVVLGLAGYIAWRQYRRIVEPVRQLQREAWQVAAGRLDRRVEPTGDAELRQLGQDFNTMAARLQTLVADLETRVRTTGAQLARAERLAGLGFFAAGVAHEVNNPLAVIATEAQLALRKPGLDDPVRRALEAIRDEAMRCKRTTDRMLTLARPTPGSEHWQPVDLAALARDAVRLAEQTPRHLSRTVQLHADDPTPVRGDPDQLKQVLLNLIANAMDAAPPPAGRVTVRVEPPEETSRSGGGGGKARVTVHDTGRGIAPDALDRVFEPFYTDRPGRPGHAGQPAAEGPHAGLGLSISHAIITAHAGALTAHSDGPGRGAAFTIDLPAAPPAPVP